MDATTPAPDGVSLIRLTARRLQTIATSNVPADLSKKASLAIIDYLGAIASGLQAPWAPQIRKYAHRRMGASQAHSWASGEEVPAESAAFVNAFLAHSAIRDDMHLKSNSHIGSIVISAALALAQRDAWTGDQLVRAIIGGYEAASLLGVAVQQSASYNRHFRPSGICGAFGAAAAAVTAGLVESSISEDVAVHALAFAANASSGYNEWAWAGGLEIYAEMGMASQSGIVVFELALAGLECSETLLEGRAGLFAALGASEGKKLFRNGLEKPAGQGLLDVRFKPAPGCNYAQTPLAVALRLAQKHKLDGNAIAGVKVACTTGAKNYPGCDNPGPFTNVQQTKMSIQFGVCAVLLHGNISEQLFQKFEDQNIAKLASACVVEADIAFADGFREGRQPARVQVSLHDGSVIQEELPDVPWLDADAVLHRFHAETQTLFPSADLRNKLVEMIEGLGSVDCPTLFDEMLGEVRKSLCDS